VNPSPTNFLAFNVELRVVENAVYRLSISLFVPEILVVKVESSLTMRALSMLGRLK